MIEKLESYLNKKKLIKNKVKIKLLNLKREDQAPVVGVLNETIFIDKRVYDILNLEELKSLCLHELFHLKEENVGNSFWAYFVFKYSFLLYICSFSFYLPKLFYLFFLLSGLLLAFTQIKQFRIKAFKSREIELACDEYAIKENGRENFISMVNKIKNLEKEFFSLDNYFSQLIFGKFHPSYEERIKKAS